MGIDFSALNLRITAPATRDVIKELQHVDDKVIAITESNKRLTFSTKQFADAFIAAGGDSEKTLQVLSRSVNGFQRDLDNATGAADRLSTRGARATQGITRGFEMVARTGKLTGRSLDAVLSNVSQLAMGFGSTGLLVGAIGIGTAAIVEMFTRTRKELEKTQTEFNTRLTEMAHAANLNNLAGPFGLMPTLKSGDPFAKIIGRNPGESDAAFTARSEGIQGLLRLQRQLESQVSTGKTRLGNTVTVGPKKELQETIDLLAKLSQQYETAGRVVDQVLPKIVGETDAGIKNAAGKKGFRLDTPVDWGNLITGAQFKESALQRMLPGTIGDMNRPMKDQLDQLEQVYILEARNAKTTEDRLAALAKIKGVIKDIEELEGSDKPGLWEKGPTAANLKKALTPAQADANEIIKKWKEMAQRIGTEVASTLASSMSKGFEALFAKGGNLKNGFKAMTGALLEGLGSMFEQVGESALVGMAFMQKIKDAIMGFTPELGIAAAIGLIALGAAMKGAGARIGSSAGSGGGGSYSSSAYAPLVHQSYANPAAPPNSPSASGIGAKPLTHNYITIIGPNDPQAQRAFDELQRRSRERGSLG